MSPVKQNDIAALTAYMYGGLVAAEMLVRAARETIKASTTSLQRETYSVLCRSIGVIPTTLMGGYMK